MLVVATPDDDRRHELRFKVERACRVFPAGSEPKRVDGLIQDISRSGVRVFLPESEANGPWLKVGDAARIVLDLPRSKKYAPRSLECTGRVVRIAHAEQDGASVAFGVDRVRIRNAGKKGREKSAELLDTTPPVRTQ